MNEYEEARKWVKAAEDLGEQTDHVRGLSEYRIDAAVQGYEAGREAGRREGLEEVATQHYRCKKCGECRCQHPESARQLEDTNASIAEYQAHVRALAAPASSSDAILRDFGDIQ